jgi:HPt (histidine-containing phosphotransfer) domain-containing protein
VHVAAAADGLVDDARMRSFKDEYPEIVDQLLGLFLESTPSLLDELHVALDEDDAEGLRRAAHKLKGSCQNVGATFMATLCRSLEDGTDDPRATLAELDAALAPTEAAMRAALAAAG